MNNELLQLQKFIEGEERELRQIRATLAKDVQSARANQEQLARESTERTEFLRKRTESRSLTDKSGTATAHLRLRLHATIQEGARTEKLVLLSYLKKNGDLVERNMLPYSYRRHLFFGKDAHTKSFIFDNIKSALLTDKHEKPDYRIEIK